MKKVININFQGQVIPIEETAYEMLQNYVASLRTYFATEEGRDEIINDIESRIAELFAEQLKKGTACISDEEVTRIMNNMGRPEDFDAPEEGVGTNNGNTRNTQSGPAFGTESPFEHTTGRGRLYRDEQDKIIGGVASGLANYFKIDPAIIRVLFVALFFGGGSGLLIYILLWIILPSRSLVTNIRKRLFRDPDEKVIAGVAGGLAKYFDVSPTIPRIIFAAPFIIGIVASVFNSVFWGFPAVLGSFGGGTFIMAYIILWIVLPEARTAAEKLEMKGEKVDLNSIRNTVVGDLEGIKGRVETAGKEFGASAKAAAGQFSETVSERSAQFGNEIKYVASRNSSGIGNALAILIKAFVYFIVGIIAFVLFMVSIGLLVGGVSVYPLHDFLLQGSTQHFAAWGTLLLFLGVPVISLLVFIIRRLMGVKKTNPLITYGFTALWIVGLVAFLTLIGTMSRSFSSEVGVRQEVPMAQPGNKLKVTLATDNVVVYDRWFDAEGLMNISRDSLYLNTVKVTVAKSKDSDYHAYLMKISKGSDRSNAEELAGKIEFPIEQKDSIMYLPQNFKVSRNDKWRNQKVMLVIEVPQGKLIEVDESIGDYHYFNLHFNNRHRNNMDWNIDWQNDWDEIRKGVPLQMTPDGLERKKDFNEEPFKYKEEKAEMDTIIQPKDSATPVIEKTEKDIYRYSLNKQEANSKKALTYRMRIPSNPLNAMLRF